MSAVFRATNTHLYPGAQLAAEGVPRLRAGDRVTIEFADLGAAHGRVERRDGERVVVAIAAHRTARGAEVAPRTWAVERTDAAAAGPGSRWRVVGRV
jgi:hypothetical protein